MTSHLPPSFHRVFVFCGIRRLAAEKQVPLACGDGAGRLFGQPSSECTPPLPLAIPPTHLRPRAKALTESYPKLRLRSRCPGIPGFETLGFAAEKSRFSCPIRFAVTTHGIQDNSVVASALCAHPIKRQKMWVIYSRSSGP